MNNEPATTSSPALRSAEPPVRAAMPPLVPVVLPLVVAAIALSILFARLFPAGAGQTAPQVQFTDITEEAGLAFVPWHHDEESPTTLGSAVVVLDFDADGHPDLFFVSGTSWPWDEGLAKQISRGSLALFRNDGRGHFTDVTAIAGLNVELQGMGAAAGDFDNDGLTDLYVTCVGTNHLFRNRGNGRFEDVTEPAGVGGEENTWSTGAAWIDCDGDGRLDLVVAHYARWPTEVGLGAAFVIADVGRSYGAPTGFLSVFPTVYHNLGEGRFTPVPGSAGLRDIDPSSGLPVAQPLAVVPVDANGDDRLDLLFSYHTSGNTLFLNEGDGTFLKWSAGRNGRQEGAAAGLSSASALPFAPIGSGDDRSLALQAAGTINPAPIEDAPVELAAKLGVAVLDLDLNGSMEILSGQGRAERNINKFAEGRAFAAAPRVFWHDGQTWAPAMMGEDTLWAQALTARGIAIADFDGDGDSDAVITQNNGPPRLLRNDQRTGLPWLRLHLIATRGHREAGGAHVEVHTPRRVFSQTVAPAMGLMAQSESTLTFGLGDDERVRKIVVRWPNGVRQELKPAEINRRIVITEP